MFERSCDNYNAYFDQLWHMLFWVTTSGIGHLFTLVLLKYNSVRGYHCSFDNMRRVKKKQKNVVLVHVWNVSTITPPFCLSTTVLYFLIFSSNIPYMGSQVRTHKESASHEISKIDDHTPQAFCLVVPKASKSFPDMPPKGRGIRLSARECQWLLFLGAPALLIRSCS